MSWKEISSVVRRLAFVKLALKAHKSMSQLCRRFGISRKTGYKWKNRFEQDGRRGLRDRLRRPHRCPRQVSVVWLKRIREIRRRHRSWGSKKLRARLCKEYPGEKVPSVRTVANWLRRLKLTRAVRRRRKGPQLPRRGLTRAVRNNHVWTVDFKGWFRTQDGQRVEPLTVRDMFSRYLIEVRLLRNQTWKPVQRVFMRLFRENGYPEVIRVDNGMAFGSVGPAGLSRLSAWWTALGIHVEFIAPGHPEQNGAHEQMHRVLKAETTRPTSRNLRAQQRRLNRWVGIYNQIRPHQSLGQRPPAELYRPSPSAVRIIQQTYPKHWPVRRVRTNGEIKCFGRKRFIGEAFVGHPVGLKPLGAGNFTVYFSNVLIGQLWASDQTGMRPASYIRHF